MSQEHSTEITSWVANPESPSHTELCRNLAAKCSAIATIIAEGSPRDITAFLEEMPADEETFELISSFCDGHEVNLTADNVVPVSCLAHLLGMTEPQYPNNLLSQTYVFFDRKILPNWNETVRAFRSTERVLQQAVQLGLAGACVDSLISKALADPTLLGEPLTRPSFNSGDDFFRSTVKRRLFSVNWKTEYLTALPLNLYEPLVREMVRRKVPSPNIAASLYSYAKKWAFAGFSASAGESVCRRNSQRDVIQAVERLLPDEPGLVSCAVLVEMVKCAAGLDVSLECRDGFEFRIGRDLHRATARDLLGLFSGEYDVGCVKRVLKQFYGNYSSSDMAALQGVAELIEEFLVAIAGDMGLETEAFIVMAEIAADILRGSQRPSDGVYRGVDVYLDKHRSLTESEREAVCRPLDLRTMTVEACDHAAKNERLPVRVVLQILFLAQMQLRDSITKEIPSSPDETEESRLIGASEDTAEVESMSRKLTELEQECSTMKRVITRPDQGVAEKTVKREKVSLWKEMKRKFSCMSVGPSRCSGCQVKRRKRKSSFL